MADYEQDYFERTSGYSRIGGYWTTPQPEHIQRVERLRQLQPESVLDVGCANGLVVSLLCDIGISAMGVDISSYIIQNAYRRGLALVRADVRSLPFVGHQFDVVTSADVLEHFNLEELSLVLAELKRVGKRQVHDITTKDEGIDPTHATLLPLEWWQQQFDKAGMPDAILRENRA